MSLRCFPCLCSYANPRTGETGWVAEVRVDSLQAFSGTGTLHMKIEDGVSELAGKLRQFARENPSCEIVVHQQVFAVLQVEAAIDVLTVSPQACDNILSLNAGIVG